MLNREEFLWFCSVTWDFFNVKNVEKKHKRLRLLVGVSDRTWGLSSHSQAKPSWTAHTGCISNPIEVILQKQPIWKVTLRLGNLTYFLTAQHKLIFTSKLSFRVRGQLIFLSATCFHWSNWLLKTLSQTHTRTQTHTHTHCTMTPEVLLKVVSVEGKLRLLCVAVEFWGQKDTQGSTREKPPDLN